MAQKTPEELRRAFWQSDLERGGIIRSQYDEVKRVLRDRDMAWAQQRLLDLKRHAIEQTDFYRGYRATDEFPVVSKTILMENEEACKAKAGFQTPTHISSTSGSTGTPFSVVQDWKKRSRNIADLKVFGELCGYPSHERMIYFRAISEKLKRTPEQEERENIYYIDCSDMGDAHLEQMKQAILEKAPRIVFGYSSTLVELARYIRRTGIPASGFSLKSVLTGGEGLSYEHRQLLESVFGCTVYRRYSDMEMGILAQDEGNGSEYVLNWGSYYFECLKADADEPVFPGEVGRIVVTDLFNYAFPMIRYDTGDLGVMDDGGAGEMPKLKEIYGRVRDCVYTTDGRLLSPARISVTMWGAAGVRQWQFIQEGRALYVLKLNGDRSADYRAYTEKLKDLLGSDAEIKVEFVDEIPVTASNKRRAVICNYHKE